MIDSDVFFDQTTESIEPTHDILIRSTAEFHYEVYVTDDECPPKSISASTSTSAIQYLCSGEVIDENNDGQRKCGEAQIWFDGDVSCRESNLGQVKVIVEEEDEICDENDDGFKTPTSVEHKIPAMTQCPPAPKRPKFSVYLSAPSIKRKFPLIFDQNHVRILDSSSEIETFFPPHHGTDICNQSKKRRRIDDITE